MPGENKMIELDKLDKYVVIGIDADGADVIGQSPNITVQDMAAMLARVQVNVAIQTAEIGCINAARKLRPPPSPIVQPGRN